MGYYASLIERKFKDLVGKKYEDVAREYSQFLLTEEEMLPPQVNSILMPLDMFVRNIPQGVYDVLSTYDATVSLVYITDLQTLTIIRELLNSSAGEEFKKEKEKSGHEMLKRVSGELRAAGLESTQRMFTAQKGESVETLAEKFDLLVISKNYGSEMTESYPVSPIALRICKRVKLPTIIY